MILIVPVFFSRIKYQNKLKYLNELAQIWALFCFLGNYTFKKIFLNKSYEQLKGKSESVSAVYLLLTVTGLILVKGGL